MNKLLDKVISRWVKSDSHHRELVHKSLMTLLVRVIGVAIGYSTALVISNLYGATAFGELSLCMTILSIAIMISRIGLDKALVRIVAELLIKKIEIWATINWCLKITAIASLLVMMMLTLFSSYISEVILGKDSLQPKISLIISCILPGAMLSILTGAAKGMKRTVTGAIIQVSVPAMMLLLSLTLGIWFRFDVVILQTVAYWISGVAIMGYFLLLRRSQLGNTIDRRVISLGIPLLMTGSLTLMMNWIDVLMIGGLMDAKDVGLYAVATRISAISSLVLLSINAIASPQIAGFYSVKNNEGLRNVVRRATFLISSISIPVLIVIYVFSEEILGWFGDDFVSAKSALTWLIFGQAINAMSGTVGALLNMTGHQNKVLIIALLATIINVVMNSFAIPRYGIEGAAFVSMTSLIFWNIAMVIVVRIEHDFWMFKMWRS